MASEIVLPAHIHFGSIEQFSGFQKELKKYYSDYLDEETGVIVKGKTIPDTFHLRGSVKLHGSHADIVRSPVDQICVQSRNRILTVENDNAGFAKFWQDIPDQDKNHLISSVKDIYESKYNDALAEHIMISGEWCGGNIQAGVALCKLPKMFVIYKIKINHVWQDFVDYREISCPEYNIYNIYRAPAIELEMTYDQLMAITDVKDSVLGQFTAAADKECPYGKSFGVSGVGEGYVWEVLEMCQSSRFWFKVKGDEHTVTKVKPVKAMSDVDREAMQNIKKYVLLAVAPARLEQGIDYLKEMQIDLIKKNVSQFIQWIVTDTLKEEKDNILELGLDNKLLTKEISNYAKSWYMTRTRMICN